MIAERQRQLTLLTLYGHPLLTGTTRRVYECVFGQDAARTSKGLESSFCCFDISIADRRQTAETKRQGVYFTAFSGPIIQEFESLQRVSDVAWKAESDEDRHRLIEFLNNHRNLQQKRNDIQVPANARVGIGLRGCHPIVGPLAHRAAS